MTAAVRCEWMNALISFMSISPLMAMGSMPTLIVVEGWVDVKIPDAYHPAVTSADTGVTTQRGRARSCDPIWGHEARAAAHASGKVLFDAHEMGENRAAA